MFKRANKVTALLVAAASLMSVVPAMASERIGTKDGTVKQGVAYAGGQYGYYGYRTSDDNTGIWYNKGGDAKDSTNDDLQDYSYNNTAKYGDKYAVARNDGSNNDEYIIDLSTGKIVDDETVEDKQDSAKSNLYSTIKKADRYNGLGEIPDASFKRVLTGQFGDVWYQFTTTSAVYDNTTAAGVVLTQEKGSSHIDVSYTANLYVYSSIKKKAVKIEQYNKVYDDAGLTVKLEDFEVLAQDKDYLYAVVKVAVTDANTDTSATKSPSTQYFLQKISKARGDKEDGIYTPKSVTSYQFDNKSIYDDGDASDAYHAVLGNSGSGASTENQDGYKISDNLYAVNNDVLYVTAVKDGKAKVYKLKLAKAKDDVKFGTDTKIASDVDTYLVKKTGDSDHDLTDNNKYDSTTVKADGSVSPVTGTEVTLNSAVSLDTAGNTWILDKGKILEFVDGSFKEMYTCDRAMDSLDVYDDGDLIAWDSNGDAYTTVQEGKKQTVDDATAVDPNIGKTTPAVVGWKQDPATGAWNFYDVNGTKTANYWVNDNGTWYYIKADGNMATGWVQWNGNWYYLKANGAMATGWVQWNGNWYYLKANGAMATGWYQDTTGTWYYSNASGAMLANTTVDGYQLGASGAWIQ